MNSQEIILLYETVANITGEMLIAAQEADWERLTLLESSCSKQVARLKSCEQIARLPDDAREHKVKIIKKILNDDRHIREITNPWMAKLSTLMQSAGTERKLNRAYGG